VGGMAAWGRVAFAYSAPVLSFEKCAKGNPQNKQKEKE
jgi:hypothetical protein